MPILTLAEAQTYLGTSDDDDLIELFITSAQKIMESARGATRHIVSVSVTENINGRGKSSLWLNEPPESVTTIHLSSTQTWDADSLVAAADYIVHNSRVERMDAVWTVGDLNLRVIYLGGFATIPEDLKYAAKVLVAKQYSEWQAAKLGHNILESLKHETVVEKWRAAVAIPEEVETILATYRPERWF